MNKDVAEIVGKYKQWRIGMTKPREPILTKPLFAGHAERNYDLKNDITKHYLQHERQNFGINLGWTDDGSDQTGKKVARWFFARSGNADTPLKYGELVALGNGESPSFIHYDHRNVGINLSYSTDPVYEWKVLGGKVGDVVHTHDAVALYTTKGDECLIYFDRDAGGDIGWPSSKSWMGQVSDAVWKEVKKDALKALLAGVL